MAAEDAEERYLVLQYGWEHHTFMLGIMAMGIISLAIPWDNGVGAFIVRIRHPTLDSLV